MVALGMIPHPHKKLHLAIIRIGDHTGRPRLCHDLDHDRKRHAGHQRTRHIGNGSDLLELPGHLDESEGDEDEEHRHAAVAVREAGCFGD